MDPNSGGGGNGQYVVLLGTAGGTIIRGNAAARRAAAIARGDSVGPPGPPPVSGVSAAIGHISWGIENWDDERVRSELKARGVVYVNAQGEKEPRPDMSGQLKSYHVPDAMGWDLQVGNRIGPTTYG